MLLYYSLLAISLTTLLYEAFSMVYKIPDAKAEKKIKRIKRRSKQIKLDKDNPLIIRFFVPLLRYIYKNIKGLRYNEFKLRADMEKAGINEAPDVYLATGYFYAFVAFLGLTLVALFTGIKFLYFLGIFFGIFLPFYPKSNLRGKIRKANEDLLKEFPNFVGTLRYQYGKGKTLNDIVQSYVDVAGPSLKYELQKLSAELEMMSDNDALLRFGERVGLPEVYNFASSLVFGQMYGMDINSIFSIQEQEMRRLMRDNIRKDMKRKPIMMTVVLLLPIINILLIIGVPPIISIINSLSNI